MLERLLFQSVHQLVEGLIEFFDSFAFELPSHLIESDAELGQAPQNGGCFLDRLGEPRFRLAMIPIGVERLHCDRVNGVEADKRFDVLEVAVSWILGAGAGPKQALNASALSGEALKAIAPEDFPKDLVSGLRAGDGNLADRPPSQGGLGATLSDDFVQQRIHQEVNAAEKKAGDGGNAFQRLALTGPRFEAGKIGSGDLPVAGQSKQERDIDVDSFGDELLDGGDSLSGGGNLDENVGPIQRLPQAAGLGDGAFGVMSQVRVNLQANVPVLSIHPIVHRAELVGCALNVTLTENFVNDVGAPSVKGQIPNVFVVKLSAGERFLENGRIRGHPAQSIFLN